MAKTMNMKILVAFLVALAIGVTIQSAEAAVHIVGDALGWQNNPPNATYYSDWASSRNFTPGDTLIFNFTTGVHDVATVTLDDYNDCDTDESLNPINNGPANIALNATGMHYYICTFAGHCTRGQKLAVNVGGNATTTVNAPPALPGSFAPSIAANFALVMFMAIAAVFM